ncbi:MAG: family 10 glycosylhydrolase [Clostridiales bacterium]|nr:family 10 glycosylhydrolase [Clostridiales bacterium]
MKSVKKVICSLISIISALALLCSCSAYDLPAETAREEAQYVKSVWLSYYELQSFTSTCSTAKEFKKAIKAAFSEIKDCALNTVTVQVRPCADAFYDSAYFPTSKYCFDTQGAELKYDPLEIMVDAAHSAGLKIEAWVNPYRVSQSSDISELSDENIAKQWYENESTKSNVYVDDKIYFNPAGSGVCELIVNGVAEIVTNYDVDGVHFDDYFYPTTDEKIDEKEYAEYTKSGGSMSLGEWRRSIVSDMVKSVYEAIKSINAEVTFGISPQADIEKNENTLYADVLLWASEEGYADYICPQVYFGFYNEVQPFISTVKSWAELDAVCSIYIGLPLYKAGQEDVYASDDEEWVINEFIDNSDVISRQITYLLQMGEIGGFYLFSFSYLTDSQNEAVMAEVDAVKDVLT